MNIELPDDDASDQAAVSEGPPDLRELVKAAFERARSSGKPTWNTMTIAVLKNRLLDLTYPRNFSEQDYGASSISSLVRQLDDMLELDESVKPPIVKLRENLDTPAENSYLGLKVRTDLWNAIVDYSEGTTYVWSGTAARPLSSGSEADGPIMPTLTYEEAASWREAFASQVSPTLSEESQDALSQWAISHRSPRMLPSSLQRQWNESFKRRVVDRLRNWFSVNGIKEPVDLLVTPQKPQPRARHGIEELRALIIRCVQHMTEEELSELRLPPQALLRGERR